MSSSITTPHHLSAILSSLVPRNLSTGIPPCDKTSLPRPAPRTAWPRRHSAPLLRRPLGRVVQVLNSHSHTLGRRAMRFHKATHARITILQRLVPCEMELCATSHPTHSRARHGHRRTKPGRRAGVVVISTSMLKDHRHQGAVAARWPRRQQRLVALLPDLQLLAVVFSGQI